VLRENLAHVIPEPACIALSARSGEGLDAWLRWLEGARAGASGPRGVAEPAAQRP
jgi:Ni2+-binding GTPase involved in maturation of urease and hydrogenase